MDKMGSFRAGGGCPSPGSVRGHRMDGALGSLEWCRGSWRSLPTHPLIPPGQEGMGPGGPCLLMGGGGELASRIPNLPGSPVALSPFGNSKETLAAATRGGCMTTSMGAPFGALGRFLPTTQGTSPGFAGWPRACRWPHQEEQPQYPALGSPHHCLLPSCRHGTSAAEQRRQRHPSLCGCQRCRRELPLLSEGFPGPHSSWIHPSALQRLTQPWGECESNGCGVGRSPPRAGDAPSRRSTGARR